MKVRIENVGFSILLGLKRPPASIMPEFGCAEGNKKPGYICIGGKWVPYTPGEKRLYVKFDIPYLDLLPGIPYEGWMWIPPGFKITEEP